MAKYAIILLSLLIALGTGCNQSAVTELQVSKEKIAALEKENQAIKAENEVLKQQNDELQFGAARLLANAKNAFDSKDYTATISTLETLKQKHPLSNQSKDGEKLLQAANNKLVEIAEQKRQEEERAKKDKEEKLAKALGNTYKSHDEVENIDWYHSETNRSRTEIPLELYIGKKNTVKPWLRMRLTYDSTSWLFVDSCKVNIDGTNFTLTTGRFKRDHYGNHIWEISDTSPSEADIEIMRKIITSKKTIIRFIGDKGSRDKILAKEDKKAISEILDAFDVLSHGYSS